MSRLIFIYNKDPSLFISTLHHLHKTLLPDKYQCRLCTLTHDNSGIKRSWRRFLMRFPQKKVFLNKDEFLKRYPSFGTNQLPLVLLDQDNSPEILISAEEINKVKNIKELQNLIKEKLLN